MSIHFLSYFTLLLSVTVKNADFCAQVRHPSTQILPFDSGILPILVIVWTNGLLYIDFTWVFVMLNSNMWIVPWFYERNKKSMKCGCNFVYFLCIWTVILACNGMLLYKFTKHCQIFQLFCFFLFIYAIIFSFPKMYNIKYAI